MKLVKHNSSSKVYRVLQKTNTGKANTITSLQVGAPSLPENIIHVVEARRLPAPFILQLVDATDISLPSRIADNSLDRKQRLLKLTLTDGSTKIRGLEYTALENVKSSSLIPGTKVKITNVLLRWGLVWLDSKNVEVLGGRVEELAEAWELQQQFGRSSNSSSGNSRDTISDRKPVQDASAEIAPSFKPFTASMSKPKKKKKDEVAQPSSSKAPTSINGDRSTVNAVKPVVVGVPGSKPPKPMEPDSTDENKELPGVGANDVKKSSKLLDRLEETEKRQAAGLRGRGRGRGGGKGRRRRHGSPSSEDKEGRRELTLQEWEALHTHRPSQGDLRTVDGDEAFARRLQEQLNLEEGTGQFAHGSENTEDNLASSLYRSMFTLHDNSNDVNLRQASSTGGRGRGRRGSRGGRRGRSNAPRGGSGRHGAQSTQRKKT